MQPATCFTHPVTTSLSCHTVQPQDHTQQGQQASKRASDACVRQRIRAAQLISKLLQH